MERNSQADPRPSIYRKGEDLSLGSRDDRLRMTASRQWFATSAGAGVGEQEVPGVVEIQPARCAKPACRQAWNVQQSVASQANHLRAVPAEERARGKADVRGMGNATQADGAPLLLVGESPAQAEEAEHKAGWTSWMKTGPRGVDAGVKSRSSAAKQLRAAMIESLAARKSLRAMRGVSSGGRWELKVDSFSVTDVTAGNARSARKSANSNVPQGFSCCGKRKTRRSKINVRFRRGRAP